MEERRLLIEPARSFAFCSTGAFAKAAAKASQLLVADILTRRGEADLFVVYPGDSCSPTKFLPRSACGFKRRVHRKEVVFGRKDGERTDWGNNLV